MNPLARAVLDSLEPRQYLTALYWEGGSGDWSDTNWNTVYDFSGSTVGWTNGSSATFRDDSITITVSSAITASTIDTGANLINFTDGGSGSLTITSGVEFQTCTFDVPVTTNGAVSFISNTFGTETNNGNATIYGSYLSATHLINNGILTWENPQDITISNTVIDNYGSIEFDGGDEYSLTLDNSTIDNHNDSEILWTSGHIFFTNASSLTNDDQGSVTFNGGIVDLDYGSTFTNNAAMNWNGGTITLYTSGSFVNTGTINWLGGDSDEIANITNDDGVIFFTPISDLIDLSGSDTDGDEDSYFTLDIGDPSELISDTITGYYVDWGDGLGWEFYEEAGEHTYTYGGSTTPSTDYTITVHIAGENGTYIAAASTTATIANVIHAPTNLSATNAGASGISISWTDNYDTNNTIYDIEVSYRDADDWYLVDSVTGHASTNNYTYPWSIWSTDNLDVRVRALAADNGVGAGESAFSEVYQLNASAAPGSGDATSFSASLNASYRFDNSNYMTLSWNHQSGSSASYTLFHRQQDASPVDHGWNDAAVPGGGNYYVYSYNPSPTPSSSSTFSLQGWVLTWPDHSDLAIVSSVDSKLSNVQSVQLAGSLSQPTITSVTRSGTNYTVSWNSVSGATSYTVYSTVGISHVVPLGATSSTSLTIDMTGTEDQAEFVVIATNSTSNSPVSAAYDAIEPPTPVHLSAAGLYSGSAGTQIFRMNWSRVNVADGYLINRSDTNTGNPSTWDYFGDTGNPWFEFGKSSSNGYYALASWHDADNGTNYSDFAGPVVLAPGAAIYFLLNPAAAKGNGHAAAIIPNGNGGYTYYSYDDTNLVTRVAYPNLAAAFAAAKAAGFTKEEHWSVNATQAAAATAAALSYDSTPYNVTTHNCWNMVFSALDAAGTTAVNASSIPNKDYDRNLGLADGASSL